MYTIIWFITLAVSVTLMIRAKSKIEDGQQLVDPLSGTEKAIVWIVCFLNPVLSGAIFYYGWKKKLPVKARKANDISLWAFAIEVLLGGLIFFLNNPK